MLVTKCLRLMPRRILATIPGRSEVQGVAEAYGHAHILSIFDASWPDFPTSAQDRARAGSPAHHTPPPGFARINVPDPEPGHDSTVFFWTALDVHGFDTEASEKASLEAP
jgi:hypothetical protein